MLVRTCKNWINRVWFHLKNTCTVYALYYCLLKRILLNKVPEFLNSFHIYRGIMVNFWKEIHFIVVDNAQEPTLHTDFSQGEVIFNSLYNNNKTKTCKIWQELVSHERNVKQKINCSAKLAWYFAKLH